MIAPSLTAAAVLLAASSAAAQDIRPAWTQVSEADGHYLTLAVPESDDVWLQLRCGLRSPARVELSAYTVPPGEGPPMDATLSSGDVSIPLRLRALPNEMTGESWEDALPLGSPVLTAFARTGELRLNVGTLELDHGAPTAEERAAATRFLRLCRGA